MSSPGLPGLDTRKHRGIRPGPKHHGGVSPKVGNSVSRPGEFQVSVRDAGAGCCAGSAMRRGGCASSSPGWPGGSPGGGLGPVASRRAPVSRRRQIQSVVTALAGTGPTCEGAGDRRGVQPGIVKRRRDGFGHLREHPGRTPRRPSSTNSISPVLNLSMMFRATRPPTVPRSRLRVATRLSAPCRRTCS